MSFFGWLLLDLFYLYVFKLAKVMSNILEIRWLDRYLRSFNGTRKKVWWSQASIDWCIELIWAICFWTEIMAPNWHLDNQLIERGTLRRYPWGQRCRRSRSSKTILLISIRGQLVISSFIWPCNSWTDARFGVTQFVTQFSHVPRHPEV